MFQSPAIELAPEHIPYNFRGDASIDLPYVTPFGVPGIASLRGVDRFKTPEFTAACMGVIALNRVQLVQCLAARAQQYTQEVLL